MNDIKQNQKWLQLISVVAAIAISGYIFFSTAFMHAHTLPDGHIVVHSHYSHNTDDNADGKEDHSHSQSEFLFYSIISKINFSILLFTAFLILSIFITYFGVKSKDIICLPFFKYHYALRAPPVFHI